MALDIFGTIVVLQQQAWREREEEGGIRSRWWRSNRGYGVAHDVHVEELLLSSHP